MPLNKFSDIVASVTHPAADLDELAPGARGALAFNGAL